MIMGTEEKPRSLSNHVHRHCPVCGARVAEGAKTCLMCDTSLEITPPTVVEQIAPRVKRLTRKQLFILGGFAVVILTAAVFLGLNLSSGIGQPLPTLTCTPTFTPSPTPTITPTPTLTPTPLPTPTPIPPQSYTIQQGDTLLSIALEFDLTVNELQAFNNIASDIIVPGQSLLIPPPTPTPGPTPTLDPSQPTPTFSPLIVHKVQRGETLSTLAERYGISMNDIRAANDMAADAESIRIGEVLQIPQYTPTPELTPEVVETNTLARGQSYSPPTLLYPPDGAIFTGAETPILLQWTSVGILDLEKDEFYRVEFTAAAPEGPVTTYAYARATTWRVPQELFPVPELANRTCTWQISIVRQEPASSETIDIIITLPGSRRAFTWNPKTP